MDILFLAPSYNNLYMPILKAMKDAGHNVTYVEDVQFSRSPFYPVSGYKDKIKKLLKLLYFKLCKVEENYWKTKINDIPELSKKYDVLFCIQGFSFCEFILNHLKLYNKDLKTSLYVWDSESIFEFSRNYKYFDKVITFDLLDSLSYRIDFLPFFWTTRTKSKNKYDISIIGSDHDGRLEIVEKIAKQLEGHDISYYFKVYALDKSGSPFIIKKIMSVEETERIISESSCILDTDRESQTGTTPRVIWALASGKKILSTNKNLIKMPFYNEKQIHIIDRNTPIVDIDFLRENIEFTPSEYINKLQINSWINNFIKF